MFEDLKVNIIELDLDVLITFIIGLGLIFFGISENVRDKIFRLKNILILYISLFIVLIFLNQATSLLFFIALGILAGGIIFLHDKNNTLERELNLSTLLIYYSFAWIFLNKTYIWILCCLTLLILKLDIYPITLLYKNQFFSLEPEYLQIFIILLFMVNQYSKVAINFFDFINFEEAYRYLKISLLKDSEQKNNSMILNRYEEVYEKLDLLSFVLFMEDKNMFNRDKPYPTIYTDLILSKLSKERQTYFPSIHFNDERKWYKKIKRFARGYGTIEQQFLRQRVLKANSYRYKIRRKIFIEFIYTEYFCRAICKQKSMTYTRSKRKNKKYAKLLRKNLKYHFLVSYYLDVLNHPKNADELLKNMSRNSRVSENLYRKIYDSFNQSPIQETYKNKIKEAKDSNYKFSLRGDNE